MTKEEQDHYEKLAKHYNKKTELESLMEQRRAIDKRIRELKSIATKFHRATFDIQKYGTDRPAEYRVLYLVDREDLRAYYTANDYSRCVAIGHTKERCLENLKAVIYDLQGLLEKMEDEE